MMTTLSPNVGKQLEAQFKDLFGRLTTKHMFQSTWDIAAFVIFFTFIAPEALQLSEDPRGSSLPVRKKSPITSLEEDTLRLEDKEPCCCWWFWCSFAAVAVIVNPQITNLRKDIST